MSKPVDMTYRFTWDTEPTDEQLHTLMSEVAEKVRRESLRAEEIAASIPEEQRDGEKEKKSTV